MLTPTNNIGVIPGVFDISRWVRPVECAFEMYEPNKPLVIKRGDPLFCVQFISEEQIELEHGLINDTIYKAVSSCLHVKNVAPNMKLKQLYELSDWFIKLIKQNIFNKEK